MDWCKITANRGDDGKTDILFGERVPKTDQRIIANSYGDMFHAKLGECHELFLKSNIDLEIKDSFLKIQDRLISLMGEIACADITKYKKKFKSITEVDIDYLERVIKTFGLFLNNMTKESEFDWSLYGEKGQPIAARIHSANTILRVFELECLKIKPLVRKEIRAYLNRLSKVLYLYSIYYENI